MAYVRLSKVPAIDTALKLSGVAVVMFAFVFVVMVPLYNVLCDVLGINGKTAGSAYTAVPVMIDESREITVQFVAIKNNEMPWGFSPDERIMRVYPGAANGTIFELLIRLLRLWWLRPSPAFRRVEPPLIFTRQSVSVLSSRGSQDWQRLTCRFSLSSIKTCLAISILLRCLTHCLMSPMR
jgi:hypothetical protein